MKWCQFLTETFSQEESQSSNPLIQLNTEIFINKHFTPIEVDTINNYEIKENITIYNQFMHAEHDRLPRLNLVDWMTLLQKKLESMIFQKKFNSSNQEILENHASIMNQLSLILVYAGKRMEASKLCLSLIDDYTSFSKKNTSIHSLALQPWINLGRLDCLAKEYSLALEKYELMLTNQPITHDYAHMILKTFKNTSYHNHKLFRYIALYEILKTYLLTKQYHEILNRFEPMILKNHINNHLIIEACLIASFNTHDFARYHQHTKDLYDANNIINLHVYHLRHLENILTAKKQYTHELVLNPMYPYCLRMLEIHDINPSHLYFIISYINTLEHLQLYSYADKLLNAVLRQFQNIGDEPGELFILKRIYERNKCDAIKTRIHNIQKHSDYFMIRNKNELSTTTVAKLDDVIALGMSVMR